MAQPMCAAGVAALGAALVWQVPSTVPAVFGAPGEMSLVVGEYRAMSMVNAAGEGLAAKWSVDKTRVANVHVGSDVSGDTTVYLVGLSPGDAVVTGVSSKETTRTVVHVFDGPELPTGAMLWTVRPDTRDDRFVDAVSSSGSFAARAPALYVSERHASGRWSLLALDLDGDLEWRREFDEPLSNLIGPPREGVLLRVGDRLTRLSEQGKTEWSHQADLDGEAVSVNWGGTIYGAVTARHTLRAWNSTTGAALFDAPDPVPTGTLFVSCVGDTPERRSLPNTDIAGESSFDGSYYFAEQVSHRYFTEERPCASGDAARRGRYSVETDTYLVAVSADGPRSATLVRRDTDVVQATARRAPDGTFTIDAVDAAAGLPSTTVRRIGSDMNGGLLLLIDHHGSAAREHVLIRVEGGMVRYTIPVPPPGTADDISCLEDAQTVLSTLAPTGSSVTAIDPVTGATRWRTSQGALLATTSEPDGLLVMRVEGPPTARATIIQQLDTRGQPTGARAHIAGDIASRVQWFWGEGRFFVREPASVGIMYIRDMVGQRGWAER